MTMEDAIKKLHSAHEAFNNMMLDGCRGLKHFDFIDDLEDQNTPSGELIHEAHSAIAELLARGEFMDSLSLEDKLSMSAAARILAEQMK